MNSDDSMPALSGRARIAGVMGWPVGHSLSPRLHGFWLRRYAIDGAYIPMAVKPEDFPAVLGTLARMGFAGTNVTVPHKEAALAAVDSADDNARRVGAVNTVIVGGDGSLSGRNTDGFGFLENLRSGAPHWHPEHGPALVIGAGGAARAICAALIDAGTPEVRLVNRNPARAEALGDHVGGPIRVVSWAALESEMDGAALMVNTTTLGMNGNPPLDPNLDRLPMTAVVSDIVTSPLTTPLLAAAAARGHRVVDGLGMLLHQARPGFAAWFGIEPEVTGGLRDFVLGGRENQGGPW
jgi:shikimate dehydrogenase